MNFVHTLSVCTLRKEITLSSSICPTVVFDMLMERWSRVLQHWNPKSQIFFTKVWDWRNWILSVPQVSVSREKKSPWLRQYQFYISNLCINGKVFMITTAWKPKNFILFFNKSSKLNFDLCQRAEIFQVGLNMNLYDDIGDALSSLWGSTSSLF